MSIHLDAKLGEIADTVFLPGDPIRAKNIADEYLQDIKQVSNTRAMSCFTGTKDGRSFTVMGSGMGLPSLSIYVHELIQEYKVKNIIRLGSCGSFQVDVKVGDLVLAQGASSNSNLNRRRFNGLDYAALSDFGLLEKAYSHARDQKLPIHVGNVLASDSFYNPDPDEWKLWAEYGVLAVDMESSELFTLGAKHNVKTLSILTVSDSLVQTKHDLLNEREKNYQSMVELAFAAVH
jgi:purine-nucleoside phosphorylase